MERRGTEDVSAHKRAACETTTPACMQTLAVTFLEFLERGRGSTVEVSLLARVYAALGKELGVIDASAGADARPQNDS